MTKKIRVLIIDDSAFARKVIREVLSKDPTIEVVGVARDGLEALEKIADLKPDVVTLDLVMPDLDGIGVLKALRALSVIPKVVIVSVSDANADLAIEALEHGAIDIVTKPTPLPTDRLYELSDELVKKVKAAAGARPMILNAQFKPDRALFSTKALSHTVTRLVVVGTSTGGPQALTQFFKMLPENFPVPMAVALHIPPGYTAQLAHRISTQSAVKMVEAYDGLELKAGQAVIAPGGMHLRIVAKEKSFFAEVSAEPRTLLYHPSVDLLFESAAQAAGAAAIGIVLTGMGNDGTAGAAKIKAAGGKILAEAESSSVVYGMPRAVFEAGITDSVAPLEEMAARLIETMSHAAGTTIGVKIETI